MLDYLYNTTRGIPLVGNAYEGKRPCVVVVPEYDLSNLVEGGYRDSAGGLGWQANKPLNEVGQGCGEYVRTELSMSNDKVHSCASALPAQAVDAPSNEEHDRIISR